LPSNVKLTASNWRAARRLGMEPTAHHSLLWIAREALKADLPPDWKLCQTPDKDPFYFNFSTAESSWEHPCDVVFKKMFSNEKRKLAKKLPGDSKEGSTPRCDGEDALAGAEQLEGCLRRAMQLDLCVRALRSARPPTDSFVRKERKTLGRTCPRKLAACAAKQAPTCVKTFLC